MRAPITHADVAAARDRILPYLPYPTPLRRYAPLDAAVGHGIRVWVKHENHLPTNAFKVRNAFAVMTALTPDERARGVIAATRGNHGMGIAYAGAELGVPVTICVPLGNNPEKNEAIRGFGATLVEDGRDYDESAIVAARLSAERGLRTVHSTNDRDVIAGAGTLTLEMLEQLPSLGAVVYAVGGGSQAVGGLVVLRALRPAILAFGVQASGAPAVHDSWHAGVATEGREARTFADGLATRGVYEATFEALRAGLAGFVKVSELALARACVTLLRTTHNLVEGAGAAGLAGLAAIAETGRLDGRDVGVVLSGANIDLGTLRAVLDDAKGSEGGRRRRSRLHQAPPRLHEGASPVRRRPDSRASGAPFALRGCRLKPRVPRFTSSPEAGRIRGPGSPAHPDDRRPDLPEAEAELLRDILVDPERLGAQQRFQVRVHALERAKDRGEHLVARRVDEAGLPARDAQSRGRVEHLVEPNVERGDAVLQQVPGVHHRPHARVPRGEVVELEEDALHDAEVFEHRLPLRVPFTHARDVVHLHGDGEVTERPVVEDGLGRKATRLGGRGEGREGGGGAGEDDVIGVAWRRTNDVAASGAASVLAPARAGVLRVCHGRTQSTPRAER